MSKRGRDSVGGYVIEAFAAHAHVSLVTISPDRETYQPITGAESRKGWVGWEHSPYKVEREGDTGESKSQTAT